MESSTPSKEDESFKFNLQEEPKSRLLQLPDYLIENYIFPYISGKELFFNVRRVHPYLHDIVKMSWGNSIKEEMFSQLKNLALIYEKDALTKAYEFKLQYLLNYRNLIMLYNLNTNIIELIENITDYISNENIYKLLLIFVGIFVGNNLLDIIMDESIDIESKRLVLVESFKTEEISEDYKVRINIILDINNASHLEDLLFNGLNATFSEIDRENVENVNESCRIVYSFLQGLIEFQILKKDVNSLKNKIDNLFQKIQSETEQWPKKKQFYENAYKLLLYSKSSSIKSNYIEKLFNFYSIRSPMNEYKEESYALMVELRNCMEEKKVEIMRRLNNESNNNSPYNSNILTEINEILFKNILNRRLLLTKKIAISENFFNVFLECGLLNINITIKKDTICQIKNQDIRIDELLKCLLLTSHTYPNDINTDTVIKIYALLKISLEEDKNLFVISKEEREKQNEISPENRKKIEFLKKQKEGLIKQKEKAEQMLNVLKLFTDSQEKYLDNQNKYKPILYILLKINEKKDIKIERIEELLRKENIDNDTFTEEEINKEEFEFIEKMEVNYNLFKEIENALMNKINDFFKQENIVTKKLLSEENDEEEKDINSTEDTNDNSNNIDAKSNNINYDEKNNQEDSK